VRRLRLARLCSYANHAKSSGDHVPACSTSSILSDRPCPVLANGFSSSRSLGGLVSGHSMSAPQYWLSSCWLGMSTSIFS
jgi:hypothetical protein